MRTLAFSARSRRFRAGRRSAVALLTLLMCGPASAQTLAFAEEADQLGITATYGLPLSVGTLPMYGGGSAGDFDNDGFQDIYVPMGGAGPDRLYMNDGDGTFTDQAAAWGIANTLLSIAGGVGDFNSDGWLDLYVTSFGPGSTRVPGDHRLYRNNGDGTFTDIAASAGVRYTSPVVGDGFSSAWGDYDLDGDLDLAVAGWFLNSGGNRLFRNNGDETFTDVTSTAILRSMLPIRGFTPRFVDMNRDRYPELLWVADFRTTVYLRNNRDGTFTDRTAQAFVGIESNGMGQTIADFDRNGTLDWYVTSIYYDGGPIGQPNGNMLYKNIANHVYSEIARIGGVQDGGWGWGTVAVDLNHDGWTDLVENNGWSTIEFVNEPMYVFLNDGTTGFHFIDAGAQIGLSDPYDGRGLLNMDIENDGDQDLIFFAWSDPIRVYRNHLAGPNTNWLRVFLDTRNRPDLAPNGIGARVSVRVGAVTHVRQIDGGGNYLSQSEMSAHYGLASATIADEVRVRWPSGESVAYLNVPVNRTITITAPTLAYDPGGLPTPAFPPP